ncbi:MAG TPA: histidine kinase dimerization/phospho-acceptor domain-containing protein [Luteimonas sp.]
MSLDQAWLDRLAHDLRGPLSPLQAAAELLRDPGTREAERERLLDVLDDQVRRLDSMVGEFSDLLAAERGQLLLAREPVDVAALARDTSAALPRPQPVVVFAPGSEALLVEGDPHRLGQLFATLLGRLVPPGCSTSAEARIESRGTRMHMACTVPCRDATDLLAASLLAAPHPDPPDGALGLGLMVATAIARAHGGQLQGRARGRDALEFLLELPALPA